MQKRDEDNCTIAILPDKYRQFLPPLGKEQKYLQVKTSVMVSDLYAINEKDLSFRMKLDIELEWFDYRITLQDLSKNIKKKKSSRQTRQSPLLTASTLQE